MIIVKKYNWSENNYIYNIYISSVKIEIGNN